MRDDFCVSSWKIQSVCETQPCFPPLAFYCKFRINKLSSPCCDDTDGNTSGADKCVTTPVSSPQISHPQLHFHTSCWVLFHLLLSFLSYSVPQCQSHRLSNPVLPLFVTGCRSTSQWHVEFFITSPRGHHAAVPVYRAAFFFPVLPFLSLSLSLMHTHSLPAVLFWVSQWQAMVCCLRSTQLYGVVVAVSDWSALHGLSSLQLWLLHCGYHPAQDQPVQRGRTSLLPMGEDRDGICVCVSVLTSSVLSPCFFQQFYEWSDCCILNMLLMCLWPLLSPGKCH